MSTVDPPAGTSPDPGRSRKRDELREAQAHLENETSLEAGLEMLLDVSVELTVEVGRTRLPIEEILRLKPGSVVRLTREANEPVELRINGKLIAHGEVVIVGENYAVRVVQIVDPSHRTMAMRPSGN